MTPTVTPTPTAVPTFPFVPLPVDPFGVQMFEADVTDPVLDAIEGLGAGWVRTRILWDRAEPQERHPPAVDWAYVDGLLGPILRRRLTPIVVVAGHPDWAATTDCGPVDRAGNNRFQVFMAMLAERYDADGFQDAPGAPRVTVWEIGNEPDFNPDEAGDEPDYGSCFGHDPDAYAAHLRAAYLGVNSANPDSTIVFGGVAHDRFYNKAGYTPAGPFNATFTFEVLDALHAQWGNRAGFPFFDWMGLHVYNDFRNNWDGTLPNDQELEGKVADYREQQMVRPGVWDHRDMPVALTEASLPSSPTDLWTRRSEALQAVYPGQLYARAAAVGARVTVWYTAEDNATGDCHAVYDWLTYGLLRSRRVDAASDSCVPNPLPAYSAPGGHEAKPARDAYATIRSQLQSLGWERQLTAAETGSPNLIAHRFAGIGRYLLVAFTDNGERIGRVGYPALDLELELSAATLPDWTGDLSVTDHLGVTTVHEDVGTSFMLSVGEAPVTVRAE